MFDSEVISAFERVEQAAGSFWSLIDDGSTLFAETEVAQDDAANYLKAMRRSYASSLQLLHRVQEFQRALHDRIEQFAQKTRQFESYISRTALKYGINLLPDELLSDIFVLAATKMEQTVALSLVCKRFRRVMMSMRKVWDKYWLDPYQSPEQILSIAEGNRFASLKACIFSPPPHYYSPRHVKTWVAKRGLDLEEYSLRYYKFFVRLILSFGPEELRFHSKESCWGVVKPIIAEGNMQNLRKLVIGESRGSPSASVLELWHMPHLQEVEADFVPGAAHARNLVRCSLSGIEEEDFDSLREFLAAAKSLQKLELEISSRQPFYEACHLPSLRSLEVDFEPHPSLARQLTQFRLYDRFTLSLSRSLIFLSSSETLQELSIQSGTLVSEDLGTDTASPVTLPNVVSCYFLGETGSTWIAKLRMPMARTLVLNLDGLNRLSMTMRNEFRTSLQSMSLLEDLMMMSVAMDIHDLDEIVRYAPPHLESFSVQWCTLAVGTGWNTSPVPRRKLIRLMGCKGIFPDLMPTFVDYLRAVDLGGMKFQIRDCKECKDGTFGLDDVLSARVGA